MVVDEAFGQDFCYCCPLHTHGGQGVGDKPPSAQNNHVMIHSSEPPPPKQEGEIHMSRDPLAVWLQHGVRMSDYCRADLAQVYPIHYHQRVRELGVMKSLSLAKLLHYREEIHESGKMGRRRHVTKPELPREQIESGAFGSLPE